MDKPENVRLADKDDIASIFWHLMADLQADNSLDIPVDEKPVFETVRAACTMDESIAGIIDGPHGIMGSICIRAVRLWFSKTTILSQVWLFVPPYARKTPKIADSLFEFAEWHRQDMSARVGYDMVLENTVLSFHRLPAKMRFWGRYGEQIGAVYFARGAKNELRQEGQEHLDDNPK